MMKLITRNNSVFMGLFILFTTSLLGNAQVTIVYDNSLNGVHKSAEDHGLTIIPGGFQNAQSGIIDFGILQGIFRRQYITYPTRNVKATNGELMGMMIQKDQVNLVVGEPVEVNDMAFFRCYAAAQENAIITIGLIDTVFNMLIATSSWEYIPDEATSRDFSNWHLMHVMFEPKSNQIQPIIQISSPDDSRSSAFVYIDNIRIYNVPKDSETIKVILDQDDI